MSLANLETDVSLLEDELSATYTNASHVGIRGEFSLQRIADGKDTGALPIAGHTNCAVRLYPVLPATGVERDPILHAE